MKTFKEKVYSVVKKIPKGKIMTYKQVAEKVNSPKAYRAVGLVLSKNYDSKIPCHRVVCSNGKPGGYNRGVKKKVELLKREGYRFKNDE